MKVELAEKAGFCFGVNRAMDLVYEQIHKAEGPICTYGPMIHNEEVIRSLQEQGVRVIHDPGELSDEKKGTVLIRSHGVSRREYEALQATGWNVVDGTCPFVKKIHDLAWEYSEKGYTILIIGKEDHPEVQGIIGWCKNQKPMLVNSAEEAENLPNEPGKRVCVLAQTTYNSNKFAELVEIIRKKGYDIVVRSTICSATLERQNAARALARKVDAMIVIGGKSSSNSRKLYEICSGICLNTYFIQTKEDLDTTEFHRFGYVGITAGASTPNNIIEEVQNHVRKEF